MKWCYAFIAALFVVSCSAEIQDAVTDTRRNQFVQGFLRQVDPVSVQGPFDFNLNESQITIQGSIDRLVISGLSEFKVNRWQLDATGSEIEFDLSFAKLSTAGSCNNVDGLLIHFFSVHGSGDFNVDVKNVRLSGFIQIDRSTTRELSVKALDVDIHFGGLAIKLERIGKNSDDVDEILGVIMQDLYYQYETRIKDAVSDSIRNSINRYLLDNKSAHALILATLLPAKIAQPKAPTRPSIPFNTLIDQVFSAIRINATEGGWDPIPLPHDSDEFSVTLFGFTVDGQVAISNARIGGFKTIHRTGDCVLTVRPTAQQAVVYVGGNDIVIGVDFTLGVGIFKTNLQIELIVRHVDIMIDVTVDRSETPANIILNDFILNEIGNVKITIGGIPGGGSDTISNRLTLLSNLVKDSLTYAFQEALKPNVEKLINGPMVRDILSNQFKF